MKYPGSTSITKLLTLLQGALSDKVDKDGNKTLSTNDYTDTDKSIVNTSNTLATAEVIN